MQRKWVLLVALILIIQGIVGITYAESSSEQLTLEEEAQQLSEVGLLLGIGDGFALDQPLTRAQAITFIIRLKGAQEEATANVSEAEGASEEKLFADVKETAWYFPYVKYCKENDLVAGYPDGSFRPNEKISEKAFLTLMLRTLGYSDEDFAWGTVYEKASEVGLVDQTETDRNQEQAYKRGNVVQVIAKALGKPVKDKEENLFQTLVEKGQIAEEKLDTAAAKRFMPPAPEVIEEPLAPEIVEEDSDEAPVYIPPSGGGSGGGSGDEDDDDKPSKPKDRTLLAIESAVAETYRNVKVKFNDKLLSTIDVNPSHFSISPSIDIKKAYVDEEDASIVWLVTERNHKPFTLSAEGLKDDAGNELAESGSQIAVLDAKRECYNMALNKVYAMKNDELWISYDGSPDQEAVLDPARYTIKNQLDQPVQVIEIVDSQHAGFTYEIKTESLVAGEVYTIDASKMINEAGHQIDQDCASTTFTAVEQTEYGPQIMESAIKSKYAMEITFDQQVDEEIALNPKNYTIYDLADPGYQTPKSVQVVNDGMTVILEPNVPFREMTAYSYDVNKVADLNGNVFQKSQGEVLTIDEETSKPIEIESIQALNTYQIQMKFNKRLRLDEKTLQEAVIITNKATSTPFEIAKIIREDDQTITITGTKALEAGQGYVVAVGASVAYYKNDLEKREPLEIEGVDVQPDFPELLNATLLNDHEVKLQFSKDLFGDMKAESVAVYESTYDIASGVEKAIALGKQADVQGKEITATLSKSMVASKPYHLIIRSDNGLMSETGLPIGGLQDGEYERRIIELDSVGAYKLPILEGAVIQNTSVIHLFFDRSVLRTDVDGTIWSAKDHALMPGAIMVGDGENAQSLEGYAYVSEDSDACLIVETKDEVFKRNIELINNNGLLPLNGNQDLFTAGSSQVELYPALHPRKGIEVISCKATDEQTIQIVFSEEIDTEAFKSTSFAFVSKDVTAEADDLENVKITSVSETEDVTTFDIHLDKPLEAAETYYMIINPEITTEIITTPAGFVTMNDYDPNIPGVQYRLKFTAYANSVNEITVLMKDQKTIVVYYPERMNEMDVEDPGNYTVFEESSAKMMLARDINRVVWSDTQNTATITLGIDGIGESSTEAYFMQVDPSVRNYDGSKTVHDGSGAAFRTEFAISDKEADQVSIADVVYSKDNQSITVDFNMDVVTALDLSADDTEAHSALLDILEIKVVNVAGDHIKVSESNIKTISCNTVAEAMDTTVNYFNTITFILDIDMVNDEVGTIRFAEDGHTKLIGINGEFGDQDSSKVFPQ